MLYKSSTLFLSLRNRLIKILFEEEAAQQIKLKSDILI